MKVAFVFKGTVRAIGYYRPEMLTITVFAIIVVYCLSNKKKLETLNFFKNGIVGLPFRCLFDYHFGRFSSMITGHLYQ